MGYLCIQIYLTYIYLSKVLMEKQERVQSQDMSFLGRIRNRFTTKKQKPKDSKKISIKQQKNAQSDKQENKKVIEMLKAPPISMGTNEVVLIKGGDQRKLCLTPNKQPFSAIGYLYAEFSNTNCGYGTAFIIEQNIVLTAAHNVYEKSTGKYTSRVDLLFNIIQDKADIFKGSVVYLPKQYKQIENQKHAGEYDFAIIILNSNVPKELGLIPMSSEIDEKDQIQIQGFPYDLSNQKYHEQQLKFYKNQINEKPQQRKYMFGCVNKIKRLQQRIIYHSVDTNYGQSGSPILRQIGTKKHAIGVHTGGDSQKNWGVRITTEVKERIDKWIQCFRNKQETEEKICLFNQKQTKRIAITPDKACSGLLGGDYVIDNTNSNVCIRNTQIHPFFDNWLCSSALPFNGEFVFTIKFIQLTDGWIEVGVMEEDIKGETRGETRNYRVYLSPIQQYIWRPNEEQTDRQLIDCSCSNQLPKCPFQIECHVNRQQNTIAWHYDGKQQAKTTMPKRWKTNKQSLCAIVWFTYKGDSVQMM